MVDRKTDFWWLQIPGWTLLAYLMYARDASGWDVDETAYWIVLPIIAFWAIWGLVRVARAEIRR